MTDAPDETQLRARVAALEAELAAARRTIRDLSDGTGDVGVPSRVGQARLRRVRVAPGLRSTDDVAAVDDGQKVDDDPRNAPRPSAPSFFPFGHHVVAHDEATGHPLHGAPAPRTVPLFAEQDEEPPRDGRPTGAASPTPSPTASSAEPLSTQALRRASPARLQALRDRGVTFALDVDGVMIRGGRPIANSRAALVALNAARLPFVVLTNGTGLERAKQASLAAALSIGAADGADNHRVPLGRIIMAQTPFRHICRTRYADKPVIVIGSKAKSMAVAAAYGLTRALHASDVQARFPDLVPTRWMDPSDRVRPVNDPQEPLSALPPIAAVFIFDESMDFLSDSQLILDVVTAKGGDLASGVTSLQQTTPIFIPSDDLFWPNEHTVPRLDGVGGFREMLCAAYEALTGHGLRFVTSGKPRHITGAYAERVLRRVSRQLWQRDAAVATAGEPDDAEAWLGSGSDCDDDETKNNDTTRPSPSPETGLAASAAPPGIRRVFMVGDYCESDIRLANSMGGPWRAVLVSTGIGAAPPAVRSVHADDEEGRRLYGDATLAEPHFRYPNLDAVVAAVLEGTIDDDVAGV